MWRPGPSLGSGGRRTVRHGLCFDDGCGRRVPRSPERGRSGAEGETAMLVREVVNTDAVTAEPGTPGGQLAKRMTDAGVGAVVVVEGGKPVAIVAKRLRRALDGLLAEGEKAEQ